VRAERRKPVASNRESSSLYVLFFLCKIFSF
jgi:hypothetical protein